MSIAEEIYNEEVCQYCFGKVDDDDIHVGTGVPIICKDCEKENFKC